ncbi:MAG: VOC family protein [bacterium]|nr:VOC family protein [bacterium]
MGNRFEVCIDTTDPALIRPFWQAALAYGPTEVANGAIILTDPAGDGPTVWFQQVPEPKTIKNRVHLDIWFDSYQEVEEVAGQLVELGGTHLTEITDNMVFADPEGNELCLNWPE